MIFRKRAFFLFLLVGLLSAWGSGLITQAQLGDNTLSQERLADSLQALYQTYRSQGETAARTLATEHRLDLNADGTVRVVIHLARERSLHSDLLSKLGFQRECQHQQTVQGLIPLAQLERLAQTPGVLYVRPPLRPLASVISQGAALIDADDWQSQGYSGAGIKIAVLDLGFQGYSALLGSELPSTVHTYSARFDGNLQATTNHGTGCAEIIYDIAPGSELYLVNFSTDVEFANAVNYIRAQGVQVVSCSIGWPIGGPGDGTGPIDQIVHDACAAGILWVNSAGNQAQRHWMGTWSDPDHDKYLDFAPGQEWNQLLVHFGQPLRIAMRWNEPWGHATANFALEIYDSTMTLKAQTSSSATGPGDPTRYVELSAPSAGTYYVKVKRLDNSPISPTIELFAYDQDFLSHLTEASSLLVPADLAEVITVGAVPSDDPANIESFSSRGPSLSGLTKPDLVAPDRVSCITYGNYPSTGFWGTSAACPHVAGAAALLWELYSSYSASQIASLLRSSTLDLGTPGLDNTFGYGRLQLGAPPSPSVTPTPTSTPLSTSSPTAPATPTTSPSPTFTPTETQTPSII
ncbi:MAG: S8 family serine peptidase, partial [Anaerolineae bacterium]|nr:S8 family serine peptidase [Anaerolineae bacterium]